MCCLDLTHIKPPKKLNIFLKCKYLYTILKIEKKVFLNIKIKESVTYEN